MNFNNGYGYTTNAVDAATGFAALGIVAIVLLILLAIIALAAAIVYTIGCMKILKKAGKPSWGAWVPGYSSVLLCETAGIDPRWVLIATYSAALNIVPIGGTLACLVVIIYYEILVNVSLARAFGKSEGFAVGLILLPVVFYPILGFGNAKYGKVKPMNDFIFKKKAN